MVVTRRQKSLLLSHSLPHVPNESSDVRRGYSSSNITITKLESSQSRKVTARKETTRKKGNDIKNQTSTSSHDVCHFPTKRINKQRDNYNDPMISSEPTKLQQMDGRTVLFSISDNASDDDLVLATIIRRPSQYNRSPYVADVHLHDDYCERDTPRDAIVHVPNLDMGGKCVNGSVVLVKASLDKKTGRKIGPNAVNAKYGTPKCEFITQLLYVDDAKRVSEENDLDDDTISDHNPRPSITYQPVWVGAHPSLGEKIAETWLRHNRIPEYGISPIIHIQKQITNPCGTHNIRSDFCITHADGTKRIIEVKTVVDADYSTYAVPKPSTKCKECIFTNDTVPYQRAAIFPWGTKNQKGPNGEAVVSARAIHHVRELTRIATGELASNWEGVTYKASILFVIVRDDVKYFYPNDKACPSFCRYLKDAYDAGVEVIAKSVSWSNGQQYPLGICFHNEQTIPIVWPK